jgi:hypothetical protein
VVEHQKVFGYVGFFVAGRDNRGPATHDFRRREKKAEATAND